MDDGDVCVRSRRERRSKSRGGRSSYTMRLATFRRGPQVPTAGWRDETSASIRIRESTYRLPPDGYEYGVHHHTHARTLAWQGVDMGHGATGKTSPPVPCARRPKGSEKGVVPECASPTRKDAACMGTIGGAGGAIATWNRQGWQGLKRERERETAQTHARMAIGGEGTDRKEARLERCPASQPL